MIKPVKSKIPALGKYLKELREQCKLSLNDVEKETGIPNAYLSQIETGDRRKLPDPDRLEALAKCYKSSIPTLLQKAGYKIEETEEEKIEKSFLHAISDPNYQLRSRINPDLLSMDIKKFVSDVWEDNVKKRYLPSSFEFAFVDKGVSRILDWTIKKVKRVVGKAKEPYEYVKYEVEVLCREWDELPDEEIRKRLGLKEKENPNTNTLLKQTVTGKGEATKQFYVSLGHEARLLENATNLALHDALSKIKETNWIPIFFKQTVKEEQNT